MTRHDTICPLDCPDACSITVTVEDGRVTGIDGNERNPVTGGYICAKVHRMPEALYGEHRVMTPLRRTGEKGEGAFEAISWDEALTAIATNLTETRERHGGEAILPLYYGGSNGLLSQNTTDARLFRRLGASRLARTVCAAPTGAAAKGLYGTMAGVAYPDYVHAKLIVVWGANPHASGIHILPYIYRAQKAGAKLVVVDPRQTKLAAKADLHLQLRPGTDLPVALSLHRWLFENGHADEEFLAEHCTGAEALRERASAWTFERAAAEAGIDAAQIETLAKWYAETSPALIRCGWGLERNRNGGSAAASVLALAAVAGKFGVRGGGFTMSNAAVWNFDPEAPVAEPEPDTRLVNMNRVGRVLCGEEGGAVHHLFVYNNNPVMTLPHQNKVIQGMKRDDLFTVVFDSFLTDSALYADIVLPATTFVERREMGRGYGAYVLHQGSPAIEPVGESRTNHEVFGELCERVGVAKEGDPKTEYEVAAAWLSDMPDEWAAIERGDVVSPPFGRDPIQFVDVFPQTPDYKAHLCPEDLDTEAPEGLYGYRGDPGSESEPLALISPAAGRLTSSTFGQLHTKPWPVLLSAKDAAKRGIGDGDRVRIKNGYGEVIANAKVSNKMRTGVVELAKGLWSHHTESGTTSNALSPDTLTDLGGGACFNDARVEVERI